MRRRRNRTDLTIWRKARRSGRRSKMKERKSWESRTPSLLMAFSTKNERLQKKVNLSSPTEYG
jgi:hypothetical protein